MIKKILKLLIGSEATEKERDEDLREYVNVKGKIILTAGRYIGGIDIPCGIYNIKILSGDGTVDTEDIYKERDKYVSIRLCLPGKSYNGLSHFPPSYNGLEISPDMIVKIGETARIEFSLSKKREILKSGKEEEKKIEENKTEEQENNETVNFDYDSMDGWQFEEFCAKLLERNGYEDVSVTSGSGDFGADVIAYKERRKYVIQCKNYSSKVGNKAVQEIYSAKAYYKADFAAVMTNNYFTEHAIEHAKGTNVILWDKDILDEMIRKIKIKSGKEHEEAEEKSKKEAEKVLYSKEKGIYPAGRYIVGEDIEIGSYILVSKSNEEGEVYLYKDSTEKEKIIDDYFEGAYYLSLKEKGNLFVVKNAHIQKI